MIEQGQRLHLLRDGELIDAIVTHIPGSASDTADGCSMELSYRGRKLRAIGTDPFDAMIALRGALEVEGLFLNVHRPREA